MQAGGKRISARAPYGQPANHGNRCNIAATKKKTGPPINHSTNPTARRLLRSCVLHAGQTNRGETSRRQERCPHAGQALESRTSSAADNLTRTPLSGLTKRRAHRTAASNHVAGENWWRQDDLTHELALPFLNLAISSILRGRWEQSGRTLRSSAVPWRGRRTEPSIQKSLCLVVNQTARISEAQRVPINVCVSVDSAL